MVLCGMEKLKEVLCPNNSGIELPFIPGHAPDHDKITKN